MYTRDTLVTVEPFTRQPEGDDVIIGRPETGVFLAVPYDALEVLEHLSRGKSVGEAADLYQKEHGETPDLDDFLGLLQSKGIVRPWDSRVGRAEAQPAIMAPARPVRYHFSGFPVGAARRIFSRPALAAYLTLISCGILVPFVDPTLAPRPGDLFFPDHRTLSWSLLILLGYAGIFVHELAHLIAARAAGVNSRIGISHRLWYLVAETDLTSLWSVPKRERYLPMLAGILVDAVSASLILLALFSDGRHLVTLPAFWTRVGRGLIFTYLMRIVWQFLLFIRTDFYYVIANFFNCRNLLRDTEAFLRNQLSRLFRSVRRVDQSQIPRAERHVILFYSVLWLAGRLVASLLLIAVTIPLAGRYMRGLGTTIRIGYRANPSDFVDALFLSISFLVPAAAGLMMWMAGLLRRERT